MDVSRKNLHARPEVEQVGNPRYTRPDFVLEHDMRPKMSHLQKNTFQMHAK
jgi:hypothetical protein